MAGEDRSRAVRVSMAREREMAVIPVFECQREDRGCIIETMVVALKEKKERNT